MNDRWEVGMNDRPVLVGVIRWIFIVQAVHDFSELIPFTVIQVYNTCASLVICIKNFTE